MDPLYFFPLAVGIALTPGPNNFCALNHGLREGVVATVVGTTGRVVAFALFLTLSALGLGAMLLASETAFNVLKWVGAGYLFWIGVQAWRSREFSGLHTGEATAQAAPRRWRELMRQEFLLGISNPKAMLLFAAIFPQFIDPSQPTARQFLVLGLIYLLAEYVSSLVYGLGGRQIRHLVRSPRAARRLNQATGGVFIGAGGLLLAAHR